MDVDGAEPGLNLQVASGQRALVWQVPRGWRGLSSASVGGGLVSPRWVTNLDVGGSFTRVDLDAYAAERARSLGLDGPGTTLLTAADVTQVEEAHCAGVQAWATVGVTKPTWALAPTSVRTRTTGTPPPAGTINIVVGVPRSLTPSALVQAVGTITEAKAQALVEAQIPGTGTASDAVVVLCPGDAGDPVAEPFAGVRSDWGQRIASAVHRAITAGLESHPWPPPNLDPGVLW